MRMWHPTDEATAAGNLAVFVEWCRATGRQPDASPARVRHWALADPDAFYDAVGEMAGLCRERGVARNLLRNAGADEALVLLARSGRLAWSRDQLRADLPSGLAATLQSLRWQDFLAVVADHLLAMQTRPSDRLLWTGNPDDPWPLGALLTGATVILCGDPQLAAREGATLVADAPRRFV
jgi:hypothetical protein